MGKMSETLFKQMNCQVLIFFSDPMSSCVTGRCKYWDKMAKFLDIVFVMGYDSQIDVVTASATSPLDRISKGLQSYIDLGIPLKKLVLGNSWYSFVYPCIYVNHHENPIPPCLVNFAKRHEEDLKERSLKIIPVTPRRWKIELNSFFFHF